MHLHPYGWLSLLPPVVAIVLAIATRRAAAALLAGIFCGALLTANWQPGVAIEDTLVVHLWPVLANPDKQRVFCFTLLMGAMIGIICRSGGMQGLIGLISPFAQTRRGAQLTTWLLGLVVFFDDYANTILLGGTLRPLCDRLKISREKFAYLVDSTAAPVAGLALLSTWVALEIDYIQAGLSVLGPGVEIQAIDLFIASIPYRFYAVMALLFVPLIAITGRDFGPMLTAERRRLECNDAEGNSADESDKASGNQAAKGQTAQHAAPPPRWYNAVLPIAVTLGGVMVVLYITGKQSLQAAEASEPYALRDILGAADSIFALLIGSLSGLVLAILLTKLQNLLSNQTLVAAAWQGVRTVLPALLILWFASSLSLLTGNRSVDGGITPEMQPYAFQRHRLYTGDFLTQLVLADGEAKTTDAALTHTLRLMPTAVFLLAGVLAFSTGTSFGTMGILIPMVVALTHSLLQAQNGSVTSDDPLLLACVGSVLAGAIFGDHCSPISDTTILSSQSCGCDHIAHVVTQFPYALTVATVSVLCGTLPIGWGLSVWLLLPLQLIGLVIVLALAGKPVDS